VHPTDGLEAFSEAFFGQDSSKVEEDDFDGSVVGCDKLYVPFSFAVW